MSFINLPKLAVHPSAPAVGRVKYYTLTSTGKSYYMLEDGVPRTYGVEDHSGLNLDDGSNPHGTTKTDVGLSNVQNVDTVLRSNHIGTQLASTISDFDSAVTNYLDRTIVQDNTEQVNTVTSPANRHSITKTPLHTALYKVTITYCWAYNDGANDFIGELLIDSSIVRRHVQEPKDVGGTDGGAGTNQRHFIEMSYMVSATQSVDFDVDFQFQPSVGGIEATIRDSVITIERYV